MQTIPSLLQKIEQLYNSPHEKTTIDVDLMLDYSRQLYAALLGIRGNIETKFPAVTQDNPEPAVAAAPVKEEEERKEEGIPQTPVAEDIDELEEPIAIPAADPAPTPVIKTTPAATRPPDTHAPSAKNDIKKLIGINDKYQIISELFHNDKDAYENAVLAINDSNSFTEATDWLHTHVSWNYDWNEDNYTVQLFYGLISQHFSDKGR